MGGGDFFQRRRRPCSSRLIHTRRLSLWPPYQNSVCCSYFP